MSGRQYVRMKKWNRGREEEGDRRSSSSREQGEGGPRETVEDRMNK